ncbi:hypothetical protein OWV82_022528 [Melia azedarach]|uniref:Uncharacterized protein n=1 Tax=Melia azedarach TaxID=155640 RepID=A0ACC1WU83_MELAZ|nr:hypothetical protein OWV82_022528 [Melia azedarach]
MAPKEKNKGKQMPYTAIGKSNGKKKEAAKATSTPNEESTFGYSDNHPDQGNHPSPSLTNNTIGLLASPGDCFQTALDTSSAKKGSYLRSSPGNNTVVYLPTGGNCFETTFSTDKRK